MEPSEQLDEMINVLSTPSSATEAAPSLSLNQQQHYSFEKPNSSSSSSSSEDEESLEKDGSKKRRRRHHRHTTEENQEQQRDEVWRNVDDDENRPSGLKTLGALLVVLCIVGAIVAVIGYTTWTSASRDSATKTRKPLWTEQHNTLSEPFNPALRAFAADLEREIAPYLLEAPNYYPCLCMHHLQIRLVSFIFARQLCLASEREIEWIPIVSSVWCHCSKRSDSFGEPPFARPRQRNGRAHRALCQLPQRDGATTPPVSHHFFGVVGPKWEQRTNHVGPI